MKPEFEQTFFGFDLHITSIRTGRTSMLSANHLEMLHFENYLTMAENSNFEIDTPFGTYEFAITETYGAAIIKLRQMAGLHFTTFTVISSGGNYSVLARNYWDLIVTKAKMLY